MNPALDQVTLPQYMNSMEAMERFLDAIHRAGMPLTRTPYVEGLKRVLTSELEQDVLDYFLQNKSLLEDEFVRELANKIGRGRTDHFCDAIAVHWYDGPDKRDSSSMREIKLSVKEYLCALLGGQKDLDKHVSKSLSEDVAALLTQQELASLLSINDQMLYRHLHAWSALHPTLATASRDEIYYRRGFHLAEPWPDQAAYRENDYITSYSLALSIPEQFAAMRSYGHSLPALVCAPCDHFNGRVLFFSPFIPGMEVLQLELGIIPSERSQVLHYHGEHAQMHEYTVEYARAGASSG